MDIPKVSVVIPVYNVAAFLPASRAVFPRLFRKSNSFL